MSKQAFMDETFRDPNGSLGGYYQLTALLIDGGDVSQLRSATIAVAPTSGFHASNLAAANQTGAVRSMLQHASHAGWSVVVVTAGHTKKSDQEPARQRCLAEILKHVDQQKITHIVADSRLATVGKDPQARNKVDLRTLQNLRKRGGVDRHLTMDHQSDDAEQLLWIPDAVGWAFRQNELRGRPQYWNYVSAVTTVVRI